MNTVLVEPLEAVPDAHERTPLKVVLIYENLAAGKSGQRTYKKLAAEMGGACDLTLWSFGVLAIPEIRNTAASAAAAADVVILSMSGKKKLPAKIKAWIEMWIWLIDGAHPAMIALLDSPDSESLPIRTYLRNVATSKGLDCFTNIPFLAGPAALPFQAGRSDREFSTGVGMELKGVEKADAACVQTAQAAFGIIHAFCSLKKA